MCLFKRLDRDFAAAEERRLGAIQRHYADPYYESPYGDDYFDEEQEDEEEDGDGEDDG